MPYVVTTPDVLTAAAGDVAGIGRAVNDAASAAAAATTSMATAGVDEVSTGIAAVFAAHGRWYQAAIAQAAQVHQRFESALAASADAYLTTEIDNAAAAAPTAAAATRITIPGAGPLYYPRFITELPYLGRLVVSGIGMPGPMSASILQEYDALNRAIGENWFPGTTSQVVDYPASIGIVSGSLAAPTVNSAVTMGQQALNSQIMNAFASGSGSPVYVAGLSEGTVVVNRELAFLASSPSAPPPNALKFAMFSSPEVGLVNTYLPEGFTIPVIDYTAHTVLNTQYDVSVVSPQYDFFSNPPDRPWNLLADVNTLFGAFYYHNTASLLTPSNAVVMSSVTTPLGGTVTDYMIPSPTLPMLLPLEQIGVPQPIVDGLNGFLKPIVDDGYSSLTPGAGPYFSHGSLVGWPQFGP
ncbi:PE-PPE domain-containing protein [Mycobacterium sp. Marseille-P9652]|uniref:PE-PPE domain-containing protein n=1 Tax=Mycobacterium sp. Marseille-P9652 TaxID=2654950 RepID=UPI0012E7E4DE|nr:PE-PPE domain-containing protein [Mycobacterium sp. Marseille-P9652]